jgi:hypothetical protein
VSQKLKAEALTIFHPKLTTAWKYCKRATYEIAGYLLYTFSFFTHAQVLSIDLPFTPGPSPLEQHNAVSPSTIPVIHVQYCTIQPYEVICACPHLMVVMAITRGQFQTIPVDWCFRCAETCLAENILKLVTLCPPPHLISRCPVTCSRSDDFVSNN